MARCKGQRVGGQLQRATAGLCFPLKMRAVPVSTWGLEGSIHMVELHSQHHTGLSFFSLETGQRRQPNKHPNKLHASCHPRTTGTYSIAISLSEENECLREGSTVTFGRGTPQWVSFRVHESLPTWELAVGLGGHGSPGSHHPVSVQLLSSSSTGTCS